MAHDPIQRPGGTFNTGLLGASLKLRRRLRKLTLRELSEQTGFSISSLSELERGEKLTFQRVASVCRALGVRLSTIVLEVERADPSLSRTTKARRSR